MPVLLVIDDETSILHAFQRALRDPDVTVVTASTAAEGLETVSRQPPDVVILDINLPDLSGLETFRQIRQKDARIPVIFITGHGTADTAIEAMKLGAYDYLLKPLELTHLRELVERALEISRLMHVPAVLETESPSEVASDVLVGRCPAMQEVYKAIGRVASQEVTVLILGESGTGKELVARAIYQHSRRSTGPFLGISCAAIPETLLESELFGHEKGAFTGADRKRIGKFEQCSGGTLFLDEIGDMTPLTQTKLLRLLQEQQFERVGGNETVKTNVRLIAATNSDLEDQVAAGRFRGDLYYRLSVFTIRMPPLRERGEDLPLLIEHFLRRFNRELDKDVNRMAPETLAILQRYPWPGNVRELQSVLKQTILQASGPVLVPDFLPDSVRKEESPGQPVSSPAFPDWDRFLEDRIQSASQDLYAEALAQMERQLLSKVLRHTAGNQVQAAKILGITRGSLRTKIRTLQIKIERSISAGDDPGE
ncbi:MAG TPA: sigma-54 dependent transcriptional regulator [Gemmataceae bacterium]|jgi:two-component system nitrogen regulation response regulator GlnG|nr:sigma-54 dependent transcriptional regulator [Gemmataceae bacterium]